MTEREAETEPSHERAGRHGLLFALAAFVWWGLAPLYFKLLADVPATLVLGHRVVWSALLLAGLIWLCGQWREVADAIRSWRTLRVLLVTTVLIAINWLVFIYAVANQRTVEASLGYFINPLVTVVLGMVFLGERLTRLQWAAACVACIAIIYLTLAREGMPWIAVVLPISFGVYSLLRKRAAVRPVAGLFVETGVLLPIAIAYTTWSHWMHQDGVTSAAANEPGTLAVLALAGVVTTVPLLCFVAGAQRLPLVTIGFLQYISPSVQLLTAVVIFGEPFGMERAIAFALIWLGMGIFAWDSAKRARARRAKEPAPLPSIR